MGAKQFAVANREELVRIVARRDGIDLDLARKALSNVQYKFPPMNDPADLAFVVRELVKAGKIERNQVPDVDKFIADVLDNRMIRSVTT